MGSNLLRSKATFDSKLENAKPLLWLDENVAAAGRHLEILMTSFFQGLRWPDIVGTYTTYPENFVMIRPTVAFLQRQL